MRRHSIFAGCLLLALMACTDATSSPRVFTVPDAPRYQLSQTGTLDGEIQALIVALFPGGLENASGTRWDNVKRQLPSNPQVAKSQLVALVQWVDQKIPQMDTPPNNETRTSAAARLSLYMALYVYSGPNTPVPSSFGTGSDAVVAVVTPNAPALVQTPLKHAAAKFDAGSVVQPTIVVVSQNTNFYQAKCSGPFTTKYCLYPLFYHYESFPHVRFEKSVHVAVCHVPAGSNYGPLPGVSHEQFVVVHDKPSDPANYTPGGYPVPDEGIEVLPRNPNSNPTQPIIACPGTTYPQVALVSAPQRDGAVGTMLAMAARMGNSALRAASGVLTPKSAYAIDNGEEHNTDIFSSFANADTAGRPDLRVSLSTSSVGAVNPGSPVTLSFTVTNVGTAPSPIVGAVIRLTPTGETPGTPLDLVASPALGFSGPLFPEGSHTYSAVVTIPTGLAGGTYSLGGVVTSSGGLPETGGTLGDNTQPVALTVQGLQSDLVTTISSSRPYAGQGEVVVATVTVSNVGAGGAPATTARLVLDATSDLSQPALLETTVVIPAIPAGGSSAAIAVPLTVPNIPQGVVNVRVYADQGNAAGESNESNNTASVPLTVGYPGVDGVVSVAEYAANTCVVITVNQPEGTPANGRLCYRNDATNLYVTLKLPHATDVTTASVGLDFHTIGSPTSVGDDAIVANRSVFTLFDDVRTACCAPQDISITGGRTNGAHAWGFREGGVIVEMVHPLNSGDVNDIALTAGQSIGVRVTIKWGSPLVTTVYPNEGYFTIPTTAPIL